jgi:outer membrane immunogenic protein
MRRLTVALLAAASVAAISTAASAADLKAPVSRAPVMAPAPVFNWTGVYIGAHAGYGWGNKDFSFPGFGSFADFDVDGWLFGGQVGFNYQINQFVFGLEGDISWSDINGSTGCLIATVTCSADVNWVGSITGRFGVAFDRALIYVKGGLAFADDDYVVAAPAPIIFLPAGAVSAGETKVGWTIGAGVEYSFAPNWSAKLEYQYMDLGSDGITFSDGTPADVDQQLHLVKFGINYRFGWAASPVVARY